PAPGWGKPPASVPRPGASGPPPAGPPPPPPPPGAPHAEVWQEAYGRLSADTHPHIAAAFPLLAADMRVSGYPFALELMLDAVAALGPVAGEERRKSG
ncbi:hypothetical protein ACFU6R_14765, partial [Streptomyces sp. NPDC057499]